MFPWVFGFEWQAENLVFLGIFYSVVFAIFATLVVASVRSLKNLGKERDVASISWHDDFAGLPASAKVCRHVITGELEQRTCPNGFDCRTCELHARLSLENALKPSSAYNLRKTEERILGLDMPADRGYHRGHTWVSREHDGTLTVGLDDFAKKIIGKPDFVILPKVGGELEVNGTAWLFEKGGVKSRILSPVEGRVTAVGDGEKDFYLRIKPEKGIDLRHLLRGREIHPWIVREIERLEAMLTAEHIGISLADGGEMVDDLPESYPEVDWDNVFGEMFLES